MIAAFRRLETAGSASTACRGAQNFFWTRHKYLQERSEISEQTILRIPISERQEYMQEYVDTTKTDRKVLGAGNSRAGQSSPWFKEELANSQDSLILRNLTQPNIVV